MNNNFQEAFRDLTNLNSMYWSLADQSTKYSVEQIFTEDSELLIAASLKLVGTHNINNFFIDRNIEQARINRLTRHISTNLVIKIEDSVSALMSSTVTIFAGIGDIPLTVNLPSTIADVEDVCVCVDKQWRIESRLITPIFVGDGAASFVRD